MSTTETTIRRKTYSTKELAGIYGISYWAVRELYLKGRIRPIIGLGTRGYRWLGNELDELLDERL
jgi:hypothetical protein